LIRCKFTPERSQTPRRAPGRRRFTKARENTRAVFCEAIANPGGHITDLDAISLRDLGMTMNPQGAHYTLMGIETLSLRMDKHVANAEKVAAWLEKDPRVDYVTYAGLKSSPYNKLTSKICPRGAGALFTVALKSGYDGCMKLVDNLEIFSHVANLGDARSLVIHSASTTHRQLTAEQQDAAGAGANVVRISIGIEDADDLIADLDQALAKASA